jgi:hypothetical protein
LPLTTLGFASRVLAGTIQADRIFHLFRERFKESSCAVLNWIGGKILIAMAHDKSPRAQR